MRAAVIAIAVGAVLAPPAVAATPQEIRFHGGAYDRASAIATDASGNSYVGGYSESREGRDSFVVIKLGPDGALRWTARYDGSRGGVGGQADAVTVDAAGNVYAAGFIHDGVMFNQNYDYLVVKFGPDGAQRWAQRYNGPGNVYDFARQVAVDGAGNVYVTGFSHGEAFGYDWATLKLSPTGALLWERRVSGPGQSDDRASELALLPGGNLVVAGVTQTGGEQFPDNDVELVVYDPQGTVVWQRRWSDTEISHEFVFDLGVDGSGRIAITGTTQENTSPVPRRSRSRCAMTAAARCSRRSGPTADRRSTWTPPATSTSPARS